MSAADRETLEHDFTALIRDRKPYVDPHLTLAELAATLGVPPRHRVQILNDLLERR